MSKKVQYFSHDYNSRNDLKVEGVLLKYGLEGIGAFWCIVEMLYEQGGYIALSEVETIAFTLKTKKELIQGVIDSNLFTKDNGLFWSESVIRRMKIRADVQDKCKKSALSRWHGIVEDEIASTESIPSQPEVSNSSDWDKVEEVLTGEMFVNDFCMTGSYDSDEFIRFTKQWVSRKRLANDLYPIKKLKSFLMSDFTKRQEESNRAGKRGSPQKQGAESQIATGMRINEKAKQMIDGKYATTDEG